MQEPEPFVEVQPRRFPPSSYEYVPAPFIQDCVGFTAENLAYDPYDGIAPFDGLALRYTYPETFYLSGLPTYFITDLYSSEDFRVEFTPTQSNFYATFKNDGEGDYEVYFKAINFESQWTGDIEISLNGDRVCLLKNITLKGGE